MKYDIDAFTALARERLSDYRFYHSLCVAEAAKSLAKRYGADEHKAEVAGILHDLMKESSASEQLEVIAKAGMALTPLEKSSIKFYHQVSGAAYAKSVLGVDDDEIVSAIRYHTTGRADMTLMQEIVYLADFISADRSYDDVDVMRAQTEKGKEYGLLYSTAYTIKSVAEKNNILHPDTVAAYNWILIKYFNKNQALDIDKQQKGALDGNT